MKDEKQKTNSIGNTSPKDSSAKLIFDNHILCAQFLRDYVDVELLKDVQQKILRIFRRGSCGCGRRAGSQTR